jgi:CBS domain containing-hemolysin-like protein
MLSILLLTSLLLLLFTAFFVLAEFASVKVRPTHMKELADRGVARAQMLHHIPQHLDESPRYVKSASPSCRHPPASIGLGFAAKSAFPIVLDAALAAWGRAQATLPPALDAEVDGLPGTFSLKLTVPPLACLLDDQ